MYRAFFSIPASVTDVEGRPANALHGYLDMTARLVSAHRPDDVVHVYDDDWKPAPRVRAYAGYKAHRLPDPEGLPEQFGVLRQVLDAFGLPQAEAPGWEAEDAIGGLSARAGRGDHIDVVTGDRDLIQLVRDPQVRVLFTVRGVTEVRVLDEAGVLEKYGVPASRYADFATLRGDPSDGIPGAPGVGAKTAAELLQAFGTLEEVLVAAGQPGTVIAGQMRPRLAAVLREHADELRMFKHLATLQRVPVRRPRDAPTDYAAGARAARKLGMKRLAERLEALAVT